MISAPGSREAQQDLQRTAPHYRHAPIAVTDSGVGGLSILRELQRLMPHEDLVYLADQANVPYGQRTLQEVRAFENAITRFFLAGFETATGRVEGAKLIVIACNTASAAALHSLREAFPQVRFVGLEPAVKPAALHSRKKVIGVIATAATFQGELYASLIDRFAQGIDVKTRACPEFVTLVERGGPFDAADRRVVREALAPLVEAGIDELVLGCTHFPFLTPLLQDALGDGVEIVDPSPAVARQAARVLTETGAQTDRARLGHTTYLTTGDATHFRRQLRTLLGVEEAEVGQAAWIGDRLSITPGK